MTTRILLVDDCKQWRRVVHSILEAVPDFVIVGEAGDGLEAIEKTTTLFPDIVLLDVGMPLLNGIEAAPKIMQTCPQARIIFLTQEQDGEVRSAALATGAKAYLLKSNAAGELELTIEESLQKGSGVQN